MESMTDGAQFIRKVNASVYDALVKLGIEDGVFWCECDDPRCEQRLTRTLREYAALADAPLVSRSHAAAPVAELRA